MSDSNSKDVDVDEEPIPKLPRAKLFGRPSGPAMIRLGMFATMLYALIMMREPCANGAARFVGQFSESDAAADASTSQPGTSTHYPGFQIVTAEEALEMLRQAQDGRDGGETAAADGGTQDASSD